MPEAEGFILGYSFGGKPLLDPKTLMEQVVEYGLPSGHWSDRANSFHLTAGMEHGYILMLHEDLADLDATALHTLRLRAYKDANTDIIIDIVNLTIVEADALYPAAITSDATAYIVTLADSRYFLARTAINAGYNVHRRPSSEQDTDPDYDSGTLNGSDPWTWEEVIANIWAMLPAALAGTLDTSAASFPTWTPQDLCFYGISAWSALFQCLDQLVMVLSLHPDGTYHLYNSDAVDDNATDAFDDQLPNLNDQTLHEIPDTVRYPHQTTVFFPNLGDHRPLYSKTILTSTIDATLDTRADVTDIIHSNSIATYDENGAITNAAELDAIADDVVTEYIQGLYRNIDTIVSFGLLDVHPNNRYDRISWYDYGDGLYTEVHTTLTRRTTNPTCEACPEGASECHVMRFQIVSVDPTTRTALVEILARPVGCGVSSLPDTILGGTAAYVCDPLGCFFNEPNDDMIGRGGWARYMQPNTASDCNPYAQPSWEVFSLCCAFPECL